MNTKAPTPTTLLWGQFWYTALHARWGIKLRTPDPARLKTQLYVARRNLGDPSLAHITIRTSPADPKGELWLVKLPQTEPASP